MTILVVGASGATGRLLVEQLLNHGHDVRAIVRSPERFSELVQNHDHLSVTGAALLDLTEKEMARHVAGCDAVASCLGHNPALKGIFGQPRSLVTEATKRLCAAIRDNKPENKIRFVLMNTIAKGAIAYFMGSQELRRTVLRSFGLIFLVGLFSGMFMLWLA